MTTGRARVGGMTDVAEPRERNVDSDTPPGGSRRSPIAGCRAFVVFVGFLAHCFFWSRHRLVSHSFEEELAVIEQSEQELR